jgi:hypothetical protein
MPTTPAIRLLTLALLASSLSASAATLTVDVSGGGQFKSITAAIDKAGAGDTILVKPGVYREAVRPKSHLRIVSEKGATRTSVFVEQGGRALHCDHVEDVTVEGFEFRSVLGVGKPGDGLVKLDFSSDIAVRDCYIHDAGNDADCVKVNDSRRFLLERCCVWNPAGRLDKKSFQEGMDTRVRNFEITVRGCWFFQQDGQGDTLIYCKGGCFDILWEGNIFGPSVGGGHANVPVQSGHQNAGEAGEYVPPYPSGRFVVRDNLFVGLKGEAAFGFQGPDTSLLYNNVFFRNETGPSLITITDNPGSKGGPALHLFSFNNLFVENGAKPLYRQRNGKASLRNLKTSHNLYGQPALGGDLDLKSESGALLGQKPRFVSPTIPAFDFSQGTQQIQSIRAGFRLAPGSPGLGAGLAPLTLTGPVHPQAVPAMRHGLEGPAKPATWDLGLHDFTASR